MTTLVSPISDPTQSLRSRIQGVVRTQAAQMPRSAQVAVGPSELGEECDRRLTYRLLGLPAANSGGDPWPSIVGTAVHAWLAEAFAAENARLGWPRYLVEQRVWLTDGISGTADLFDVLAADVIDHKVLGTTSMSKIRHGDVPARYRTQIHLYGYGFRRIGFQVKTVSIAAYPRGGWLDGLHIISEPYDETVALAAMDRQARLVSVAAILRLDDAGNPGWSLIPHRPGPSCAWCPFWRPGQPADAGGCPGPL